MTMQFLPPVAVRIGALNEPPEIVRHARQALQLLSERWPECSSQEFEDAALSCLEALGGGDIDVARRNFVAAARAAGVLELATA